MACVYNVDIGYIVCTVQLRVRSFRLQTYKAAFVGLGQRTKLNGNLTRQSVQA